MNISAKSWIQISGNFMVLLKSTITTTAKSDVYQRKALRWLLKSWKVKFRFVSEVSAYSRDIFKMAGKLPIVIDNGTGWVLQSAFISHSILMLPKTFICIRWDIGIALYSSLLDLQWILSRLILLSATCNNVIMSYLQIYQNGVFWQSWAPIYYPNSTCNKSRGRWLI